MPIDHRSRIVSSQVQLLYNSYVASRSQQGRKANSCEIGGEGESHTRYLSSLFVQHPGSAEAHSRHCSSLDRSMSATSRNNSGRRTLSTQLHRRPHPSSCRLQNCNCVPILASPPYHTQNGTLQEVRQRCHGEGLESKAEPLHYFVSPLRLQNHIIDARQALRGYSETQLSKEPN